MITAMTRAQASATHFTPGNIALLAILLVIAAGLAYLTRDDWS